MVLNGLDDLSTLDGFGGYVSQHVTGLEILAILELNELVTSSRADVADDPAALVVAVLLGLLIEVVASLDSHSLALLTAVGLSHVDGQLCLVAAAPISGVKTDIRTVEILVNVNRKRGHVSV